MDTQIADNLQKRMKNRPGRDSSYPTRACAARGKVIGRGWCPGGVYKSTLFLEPIFYLSKHSLSELYFNTDRLLI